jgi:hypothetical protein
VNTKTLRVLAVVFAALAMGMHLAHALELVPKRQWEPEFYLAVQSSLYLLFGIIGPVLEIGTLVLVTLVVRSVWAHRTERMLPLLSASAIALALLVWAVVVLPANAQLSSWRASHVIPPDWARWRDQWQFGQASIFLVHLVGFLALVSSSIKADTQNA